MYGPTPPLPSAMKLAEPPVQIVAEPGVTLQPIAAQGPPDEVTTNVFVSVGQPGVVAVTVYVPMRPAVIVAPVVEPTIPGPDHE